MEQEGQETITNTEPTEENPLVEKLLGGDNQEEKKEEENEIVISETTQNETEIKHILTDILQNKESQPENETSEETPIEQNQTPEETEEKKDEEPPAEEQNVSTTEDIKEAIIEKIQIPEETEEKKEEEPSTEDQNDTTTENIKEAENEKIEIPEEPEEKKEEEPPADDQNDTTTVNIKEALIEKIQIPEETEEKKEEEPPVDDQNDTTTVNIKEAIIEKIEIPEQPEEKKEEEPPAEDQNVSMSETSESEYKSPKEKKKRKRVVKHRAPSSASDESDASNTSPQKMTIEYQESENKEVHEPYEPQEEIRALEESIIPPISGASRRAPRPIPPASAPGTPRAPQRVLQAQIQAPPPEEEEKVKTLTDEQIENYRQMALQQQPIRNLTDDQYDELLAALVVERNEAVSEQKFAISDRINSAYDFVQKCKLDKQKHEAQSEALTQYKQQLKEVNAELAEYDKETEKQLSELLSNEEKARERLQKTHEAQLDAHVQDWTSEKKQRQYNRASHGLINLRKQFKRLVQQCRFKEAGDVQKIITRAESKEQYEAHLCMQRDYDNSLRMLQHRQRGELQFFEQQSLIRVAQLKQRRERRRVALVNKQKKVEQIGEFVSDSDRVWGKVQTQKKEEAILATSGPILGRQLITARTTNVNAGDSKEDATICLPPLDTRKGLRSSAGPRSARI